MRQCRPPGSLPAPCGRGASAVVGCRRAACRLIPGVQLVAGGWQPAPCRRLATTRQAPRRRLPGQCGRRSKMVRARGHAWTRLRRCRAGLGARAPTGPTHASCPYRFCARTRRLHGARRLAALNTTVVPQVAEIGRNWCPLPSDRCRRVCIAFSDYRWKFDPCTPTAASSSQVDLLGMSFGASTGSPPLDDVDELGLEVSSLGQ